MTDNRSGTVLVVDNDASLRYVIALQLRAAGFEVIEGADGRDAIELAKQHTPDVIVMDVMMPEMNGISATHALREDPATASIPVIMITCKSGTEDLVEGFEAGAQAYLQKPFDVAELVARVQALYRQAAAHRGLDEIKNRLEQEVDVKTNRLRVLYNFMRALHRATCRDEILDLVVGGSRDATGANRVSLLLMDAGGEHLQCVRAVGMDPGVVEGIPVEPVAGATRQAFQTGAAVATRAFGARLHERATEDTLVSTPLTSTSRGPNATVMGVLNVTDKEDGRPFSKDDVACLRSIADAAAIALDNLTRRTRLEQSVKVLLETVGFLAEYRDEETSLHLRRVSRLARILATRLSAAGPYARLVNREFIEQLVQAAPMHDIGKVGVPDDILTKPGKLTPEEFAIMRTHTEIGRRVLSRAIDPADPVPILDMCAEIAYCHHERYDGKGYPQGLRGKDIPLAARIIALVDAYDAITSHRRYQTARLHAEAVRVIKAESGRHFDPVLVEAFLACHEAFNEVRVAFADAPAPNADAAPPIAPAQARA
ncbi:MAG: HD domain-containing phosphohydrolase [Phycisphaerae bacterium]